MSCSLVHPGMTIENHPNPVHDMTNGPGGFKHCVHAAIGLGYNGDYPLKLCIILSVPTIYVESSILIAMRSHRFPSATTKPSSFDAMDLSIPLDLSQQTTSAAELYPTIEWESWGEESIVELCEVQLSFDGVSMSAFTQ